MMQDISRQARVPANAKGQRLDAIAASLFPEFSRGQLQGWIKAGELTVNGERKKPNNKLAGGESLSLEAVLVDVNDWQPEAIPIDVVYEDDQLLVVNKPAGMVVHPAAGNYTGTLLNALLYHVPEAAQLPRAGIVHRLDKDTTGLMVVAKTLSAQNHLVQQLQSRTVSRRYFAAVYGPLSGEDCIDQPIGRDPKLRTRMAVVDESSGKEAITHYVVEERFQHFSLVKLKLETGRTHQIRVHMAHIGHGLIGDSYKSKAIRRSEGGQSLQMCELDSELLEYVRSFPRQALHAAELGLIHPKTQEQCSWSAPLPQDICDLLTLLRERNALP